MDRLLLQTAVDQDSTAKPSRRSVKQTDRPPKPDSKRAWDLSKRDRSGRGGGYWIPSKRPLLRPVVCECCCAAMVGAAVFAFVRKLNSLGLLGYQLRTVFSASMLLACVLTGALQSFSCRLGEAFLPTEGRLDHMMWKLFVYGKYLGVAFLELTVCIASLTQGLQPGEGHLQLASWTAAGLLAFNIAECAVVEARIHHNYAGKGVAIGALLNAVSGGVLTMVTLIHPIWAPVSITPNRFSYNHMHSYVIAYALWNIKFASVAQDDGTIHHIGNSHLFSMIGYLYWGTDYMEYRVFGLLVHFSIALIWSHLKLNGTCDPYAYARLTGVERFLPPVGRVIGFGAFYDAIMHGWWMRVLAWATALATAITVGDLVHVITQ